MIGLLLLGGCTKKAETENQTETGQEVAENQDEGGFSLKELLALGKDQKCSWKIEVNNQTTEGIMWISGKKFRQEILVKAGGDNQAESKVISVSDGTWIYVWNSELGSQGVKMKIEESESGENNNQTKIDWEKKFNYACQAASINQADLEPPKNIDFQDMNQLIEEMKNLQNKYGPTGTE